MKALALIITSVTILQSGIVHSQDSEKKERHKVNLRAKDGIEITKMVKIKHKTKLPKGSIVEGEYKEKSGDTTFTIKTKKEGKPSLTVEKTVPVNMGVMQGNATLTFSEDNSYIKVNYWLEGLKTDLKTGQTIVIIKRTPDLDSKTMKSIDFGTPKAPSYQYKANELRTLEKDTSIYMTSVLLTTKNKKGEFDKDERLEEWFKQSAIIIVLFNPDKSINSIYAEKYDNDGDYRIISENRDPVILPSWDWKAGIVSIPFRYRFGFEKNGIRVPDDFSGSLNVGPFFGYSRYKLRLRYEGSEYVRLPKVGATIGVFLNIGSVTIDSLSSTVGKRNYSEKEKTTIGIISPGFGMMFTVNDINFGVFGGWDVGFGSEPKNWNYNNRFWLGFGLNYSITSLFTKPD